MNSNISVIIPAYNCEDSIRKTVSSVISQTRYDLVDEIIVIDDGSTDNTADVVKKISETCNKIKLIGKENGGVSSARNLGIRKSHGTWIALIDSDDEWLPEKLEKQWEKITENPGIKFIGCGRNYEKVFWGKKISDDLYELDLDHMLIKNWPHTSTVLIHRNILRDVGLFNEKMRYGEDGDLWFRIVVKYSVYYIPQTYEIAGSMKRPFGETGLSANLQTMHIANMRNIRKVYKEKYIGKAFYIFLTLYTNAKYVRRKVLTKVDKIKNRLDG